MPRVPTYDSFQVTPSTLPGARFSSQQVLAPTAPRTQIQGVQTDDRGMRAAQQLGDQVAKTNDVMTRIAVDAMNQANQVRVNDALNQAVQARLNLTYNPEGGYVHLKGDAALNRPDGKPLDMEYTERYQQQIEEISKGLGNEAQRAIFQQKAGELATQFRGSLNQHVAKEYGSYQLSVQEGTIKTNVMQMAASWGDPMLVAQSTEAIKAAVAEQGRIAGFSAQQIEANTVTALSAGNMAVIVGATDAGMTDYAREFLTQHEKNLTPEARLQAKKILDAGDFEARTQDAADDLYAKFAGDTSAALAEARKNFKGKEEDAIVTRIKTLDAERVTLRERTQRDAADKAWRIYADTGGLGKIPASVMSTMDGKDLDSLRRTARADAEARGRGVEVKTDPNVYYALSVAAATDPEFKNEDLRRYFDALSPGDRKHFIDMQAKTLNPNDLSQITTAQQQIGAVIKSLDLKSEQAGLFTMEANKALFTAQQRKGKALDESERQKVLDTLVIQGEVIRGSWYLNDPNMRLFEAQATGQIGKFAPRWSSAQTNKATAALQRQGIKNPTQQQVEAVLRATYDIK
jgi:hypothetical protein